MSNRILGKPAKVRYVQLSEDNLCNIFGAIQRPKVCSSLRPSLDMCHTNREEAMAYLIHLEKLTSP
ncbi:Fe-S-cluster oxidoreductase [Klebsiella grimontii]|nr:Fe-S-cluster oxidoreductase [Klebsiella grimontii]MBZ7374699.1 Fe-S-cluster oxidoreductase [Klebsiella grimontii]